MEQKYTQLTQVEYLKSSPRHKISKYIVYLSEIDYYKDTIPIYFAVSQI